MNRYALTKTAIASVLFLGACSPKDERSPKQTPMPLAQVEASESPENGDEAKEDEAKAEDPQVVEADGDGEMASEIYAEDMLVRPEFDNAGRLTAYCDDSLKRSKTLQAAFSEEAFPSALAALQLDAILREISTLEGYVSLHFNVNPSKDVRDAADACQTKLSQFSTELSLDRQVFLALKAQEAQLTDESPAALRHFLEKNINDFVLSGVDKDDETRQKIKDIQAKLSTLEQNYQKTVNADTRTVLFDSVEDLDGLPEDWLAAHPKDEDGKISVTTNYPDLFPVLTYATSSKTRARLQAASAERGYPDNKATLEEVLSLREELAQLIGFPNFAALDLKSKMAESVETVTGFLEEARQAASPRVKSDLDLLLKRIQKEDPEVTAVTVSDRLYLTNLVRSETFDYDAKAVRQYFPYEKVKAGIFELYGELFNLQFKPLEDVPTWDPSVEAWAIIDKNNKDNEDQVLGQFYLDMHPREHKYKHAAMFPIQGGTLSHTEVLNLDGKELKVNTPKQLAWASLVCNFPNPREGDALMEHGDVVTFFHEFGHLIHHLLAQKTEWAGLSGISMEWDFVEAPSQLLEEWAWDPGILARFAKNKDGEAIPEALVKRMKAADELGLGINLQRQLFFAAYSLGLHTIESDKLDLDAFTDEVYKSWSPYPRPEADRIYANFAHLIGYKEAYYTYQWSLAIAKDLFTAFQEKGIANPEVAMRYRELVLEPAATKKASELVQDFLGRPQNLDAYRAWIRN